MIERDERAQSEWIKAKQIRRPLQLLLKTANVQTIVSPRPNNIAFSGGKAPLKERKLSSYGYTTQANIEKDNKRKREACSKQIIEDSQAGTDFDLLSWSQTQDAQELIRTSDLQLMFPKRQRTGERNSIITEAYQDEGVSKYAYGQFSTPRKDTSREVPSSVQHEQRDFQPWCEESPVKRQKRREDDCLLVNLPDSPPPSSPQSRSMPVPPKQPDFESWYCTPPTSHHALTPPPSALAFELSRHVSRVPAITVYVDAEERDGASRATASRSSSPLHELQLNGATPLRARQSHARTTSESSTPQRGVTAISDTASEDWHDAQESLPDVAMSEDLDPSQMVEALPGNALHNGRPTLITFSTVQDSQIDECLTEPLQVAPLPIAAAVTLETSTTQGQFSWQQDTMPYTLSPPDYPPSRSAHTDDASQASVQATHYPDDLRDAGFEDAMHVDEQFSFELDDSLMHTLLPPIFLLPSTADE